MKAVNIHEAKTKLSALLSEVEATGTTFLICRNGNPIAELVPHKPKDRLTPHPLLAKIEMSYDPTEPLSDEEWLEIGDDS
ncbi:MAG: type II toxin-antitoxin system prevent-host-death family antitoxin [Bradymonadales bacterium]|nr:type II toxin-antitoxin system prevent-host-death family antitoxin [Bradymonadales bacterium]